MNDLSIEGQTAVQKAKIELLEELIEACEAMIGISGGRDIRIVLSILNMKLQENTEKLRRLNV